jgi:NAD(P)-dependent dehydrogenase (short-subunit alcohol dehydrogenase family)
LGVIVNNDEYGDLGSVEEASLASFRSQIETNLLGTIIVSEAAIPTFRRSRNRQPVTVQPCENIKTV